MLILAITICCLVPADVYSCLVITNESLKVQWMALLCPVITCCKPGQCSANVVEPAKCNDGAVSCKHSLAASFGNLISNILLSALFVLKTAHQPACSSAEIAHVHAGKP